MTNIRQNIITALKDNLTNEFKDNKYNYNLASVYNGYVYNIDLFDIPENQFICSIIPQEETFKTGLVYEDSSFNEFTLALMLDMKIQDGIESGDVAEKLINDFKIFFYEVFSNIEIDGLFSKNIERILQYFIKQNAIIIAIFLKFEYYITN